MPVRRKREKLQCQRVSHREIQQLRQAIRDGWPWRLREDEKFRQVPLNAKLQICLSHLTGVFTLAAGFPLDPHPSDETLEFLRGELADELEASESKWGHLIPLEERWCSEDLRFTTAAQRPRELY